MRKLLVINIFKIKINFDKKIIEFYRKNQLPYVEYYPKRFLLIIYDENELSENLFTKSNNFYSYYKKISKQMVFLKFKFRY